MDENSELSALRREVDMLRAEVSILKSQIALLIEGNNQRFVENPKAANLRVFHERIKSILRSISQKAFAPKKGDRAMSQNDLARAINIDPGDLSKKFAGKLPLQGYEIKRIVKQLVIWGGMPRLTAQELLHLMGVEDFSVAEWKEIDQQSLELQLSYEPYSREDLRQKLRVHTIDEIVKEVGEDKFKQSELEEFIQDRGEPANIRRMVFELYLRSNPPLAQSSRVASALLKDFEPINRDLAVQRIKEYNLHISNDDLIRVLSDHQQDVVLHAVKLAAHLLAAGKISAEVLVHPNVVQHPYWLIRKLAIDAIANNDPMLNKPNTVRLLCQFKGVTYWVSRRRLMEYFAERYRAGNLQGSDYHSALAILEKFTTDGKLSSQNIERAERVLALLKGCN